MTVEKILVNKISWLEKLLLTKLWIKMPIEKTIIYKIVAAGSQNDGWEMLVYKILGQNDSFLNCN